MSITDIVSNNVRNECKSEYGELHLQQWNNPDHPEENINHPIIVRPMLNVANDQIAQIRMNQPSSGVDLTWEDFMIDGRRRRRKKPFWTALPRWTSSVQFKECELIILGGSARGEPPLL
ncbi:hypothetical protein PV325_005487 [Microctonus aethiopoides]|nr:hypothetical protein PV326_013257 [Microctonus aethiopoides]KAK0076378.1 hypothetical protein PV325_005487 [Microctonus aethiopoides]